ncbi:hypothetical protein EVAR_38162_1 [Eumeta japonica]|uniref:Uncharacterized protein n=1 Tax=Eumeta variegata TaxID=151549 RepID=A0A4C1ZGQ1_EUMVA|nr:hypothetical protein EVAR_38162_1 [Eumeta japonica]
MGDSVGDNSGAIRVMAAVGPESLLGGGTDGAAPMELAPLGFRGPGVLRELHGRIPPPGGALQLHDLFTKVIKHFARFEEGAALCLDYGERQPSCS